MKVQKVLVSPYEEGWLVLDNECKPIKCITELIKYLRNVDKSPCTIHSYPYHLKPRGILDSTQFDLMKINLFQLAAFVGWLRNLNKARGLKSIH